MLIERFVTHKQAKELVYRFLQDGERMGSTGLNEPVRTSTRAKAYGEKEQAARGKLLVLRIKFWSNSSETRC